MLESSAGIGLWVNVEIVEWLCSALPSSLKHLSQHPHAGGERCQVVVPVGEGAELLLGNMALARGGIGETGGAHFFDMMSHADDLF